MSPGPTRRSSFAVFLSTRAMPLTPGNVSLLRDSRAGIFMASMMNPCRGAAMEARRTVSTRAERPAGNAPIGMLRVRRSALPFRVRHRQQFLRVRPPGLGVVQTREHPREFGDAFGVAEVRTPLLTTPPPASSTLSTTRCVSANAATCG